MTDVALLLIAARENRAALGADCTCLHGELIEWYLQPS